MTVEAKQEQALRERTPEGRILSLDALRGIAAFVVIWHHLRACFYAGEPRYYLRPLFAGRASVVLFFVLSGYVLAIPIWRQRQLQYGRYLLRRVCRIYLPYVAGGLLAFFVGRHLLFSHTGLTPWFDETWQASMTAKFLMKQLVEIPTNGQLNTAFWSLRYEFEMSLIFPFVCFVLGRMRSWIGFLGSIVVWKIASILALHGATPFEAELLQAIRFGTCFLLGALLSRERAWIGPWYRGLPMWVRSLGAALVASGYYSSKESLLPVAACGILIFAEYSVARKWLTTAVPEYLGRISYSMYLVHGTVLWALMILFEHKLPIFALVLVYAVAVLVISHLFCVGIEEPAMRLGRRLTSSSKPPSLGEAT